LELRGLGLAAFFNSLTMVYPHLSHAAFGDGLTLSLYHFAQ
jgi:hypothetical protein